MITGSESAINIINECNQSRYKNPLLLAFRRPYPSLYQTQPKEISPLSFCNNAPLEFQQLASQHASAVVKKSRQCWDQYGYLKYLRNKHKFDCAVDVSKYIDVMTVTAMMKSDDYTVDMLPFPCFYIMNKHRYRGIILYKESSKTVIQIDTVSGPVIVRVAISSALKSKQVMLIDKDVRIKIASPTLFLKHYINNNIRQNDWFHKTSASATATNDNYNEKYQYHNTPISQKIEWLKRQQYNHVLAANDEFGNKYNEISVGEFYELYDGKIILIKSFIIGINSDSSKLHQSVQRVIAYPCLRASEFKKWYVYNQRFVTDTERCINGWNQNKQYLLKILTLDMHSHSQIIMEITALKTRRKVIVVTLEHFLQKINDKDVVSENEYFCFFAKDGQNKSRYNLRKICVHRVQHNIKYDCSALPETLKNDNTHIVPYALWIDAFEGGVLSVELLFLNVAVQAMALDANIHQVTCSPNNISTEDLWRILHKIGSMIKPLDAEVNGKMLTYYPYQTSIICDSHEWARLCIRKQIVYTNKCVSGKSCDTHNDIVDPEHKGWMYPTSIDHYVNLSSEMKTDNDWKESGYVQIDTQIVNNMKNLLFVSQPIHSVKPDIGHHVLNGTHQLIGAAVDRKVFKKVDKPKLFSLVQHIISSNHLCSQPLKWDTHWESQTIFKNITLDLAPAILIAMEMTVSMTSIFDIDDIDTFLLESILILCDSMIMLYQGNSDPRIDYHALSMFVKTQCFTTNIGVTKYKSESKNNVKDDSVIGTKNGFTAFTAAAILEALQSTAILSNNNIYNTNKFEKVNKESKAAIRKSAFTKTSYDSVFDNSIDRLKLCILMEGGGLTESGELCHGANVIHKLSETCLALKPLNAATWANLSTYIDRRQNPDRDKYTNGHTLTQKIQNAFHETEQRLIASLLNQNIVKISLYKKCKIWRKQRLQEIIPLNTICINIPKTQHDHIYQIQSICSYYDGSKWIDAFLCKRLKINGKYSFPHRVWTARVTNEWELILVKDTLTKLITTHICRSSCKIVQRRVIEHDWDNNDFMIHWFVSKYIKQLFLPFIAKYRNDVCSYKYCRK